MDTGATHHMTGNFKCMIDANEVSKHVVINLPNGESSVVTHNRNVKLENGICLRNVMYIPDFKHNLMSIQKLTQDTEYRAIFQSNFCIVEECESVHVRAVGKEVKEVHYLVNEAISEVMRKLKAYKSSKVKKQERDKIDASGEPSVPTVVGKTTKVNMSTVWHLRLGHAPLERLAIIQGLKGFDKSQAEVCLTCPVAKLTKQPFKRSNSRASQPFELIHIDTWGPYRVPQGHKFFLTIVDDHTRTTWIYLMKTKDEAFGALKKFVAMAYTQLL
ncbi:Retrovirus-related Pol polyprotein from transposon RE1 [Bienertia sinuspersici]